MIEPLTPSSGWGVLHLFCTLTPLADPEAIVAAVKSAEGDDHQVVTVAVLGHKADLAFMALGSDLWRLRRLQADLFPLLRFARIDKNRDAAISCAAIRKQIRLNGSRIGITDRREPFGSYA